MLGKIMIKRSQFIFALSILCLFCFVAKAHTDTPKQCSKPTRLNQSAKQEMIESVRKIVRDDNTATGVFWTTQNNWRDYFRCLEETKLGFSIEQSGLSFEEKVKLYGELTRKALSALLESLDLNVDKTEAKTVAAQIVFLSGDKSQARNLATEAIILDAKNFEAHFVLGSVNRDLVFIERAITLNPKFAPAYQTKVEMLMNEANVVNDEARQLKYAAALETLKVMVALPSLSDTEFWKEQHDSLAEMLKPYQTQNVNPNFSALTNPSESQIVSTKPSILATPRASYTEFARRMQTSGTVRIRATLSADKQIRNVLVMTYLPHGLSQEAFKAAKQIKFEPATRNGKPFSMSKIIEYNFNLY